MNAAIRSVVRTCAYHNIECIGIYRGYQGMIEGDFKEIGPRSVNNIVNKGGTIIKSARSFDFRTPEGRKKAYEHLKKNEIDALVPLCQGQRGNPIVMRRRAVLEILNIPAHTPRQWLDQHPKRVCFYEIQQERGFHPFQRLYSSTFYPTGFV